VIAVFAGAMVFGAKRDRGGVWGFLADAVWAGVGSFDASPRPAKGELLLVRYEIERF